MSKTIGEQRDIVVTINHGAHEYSLDFVQGLQEAIDNALGPQGFSRSSTTSRPEQFELVYFQFGWAAPDAPTSTIERAGTG